MATVFTPGGFQSRRDVTDPNVGRETVRNIVEDRGGQTTTTENRINRSRGSSSNRRRREAEQQNQQAQVRAIEEEAQRIQSIAQQEAQKTRIEQANKQSTAGQVTSQDKIPSFNTTIQKPYSSQAVATGYRSSDYLNDERASTGGFLGSVSSFLGLDKDEVIKLGGSERTTRIDTSISRDPFIIDKKQQIKEDVLMNPNLTAPSSVFTERLGQDISKDIEKELKGSYQSRVDRGEDISKVTEDYNKEFTETFEKEIGSEKVQRQLRQKEAFDKSVGRAYRDPTDELKKLGTGSLDVGVSLLGPEVSAPYFAGKGIYKTSKGSKKDILLAEKDIFGNTSVPLYPSVATKSKETKEGELYLGFAGLSALGIPGALTKRAGQEQLKDLAKQRFTISGKEMFKTDSGNVIKFRAERSIGSAKEEVDFLSTQLKINKGSIYGRSETGQDILLKKGDQFTSFFITKGKSRIRAVNPIDQNIKIDLKQTFGGGGRARSADKLFIGNNKFRVGRDDLKGSYGSGYLEFGKSGKLNKFNFLGGSRQQGGFTKVLGADVRKVRFSDRISIRGRLTGIGEIKMLPKTSQADFIIGSGSKSGFPKPSLTQDFGGSDVISANVLRQVSKQTPTFFKVPKETFRTTTRAASRAVPRTSQSQSFNNQIKQDMRTGFKGFNAASSMTGQTQREPKTITGFGSLVSPTFRQGSRDLQIPIQAQMNAPILKEFTRQTPRGLIPFSGGKASYNPFGKTTGFGFGFGKMPNFSLTDYGRSGTRGSNAMFKGQYNPNVASRVFNIKAFKIPKSYFRGAGGITIRPLITSRRRRKRR
jgi:hypothetical protein